MKTLGVKPAVVAAVLAVAACSDPRSPAPHPLGVTPDRGLVSLPVPVTIHGTDFAASTSTDFEGREPSTLDARFQAFLGATALRDVRLNADGSLSATVPEGLAAGLHDLRVVDPEGREGLVADAYRGLTPADVAQLVASYRLDPIGAQQAWAPFPVTITAIDAAGGTVTDYNGAVVLSDLTGTVVPGEPALFRDGVWSGKVEVRAAHGADVLSVVDPLGNAGASAPFVVTPAPAAALRFATPPRSAAAGACSGPSQPLTVEVTDAFGVATVAAADLPLSPSLTAGLALFADSACATPLAAPIVAAGTGSLTLWFRSTAAGAATVSLTASSVAAASQLQTVVAGAPAKVVFVTAAQTVAAGSCSAAATLEVRDAWDNPTVGGAVAISLDSVPTVGFELFADSGCTTPAATVGTAPATARADLWFRGTTAQPVSVTASSAGLDPATQSEAVTAAPPDRLAFESASQTVPVGSCSAAATVSLQDPWGNPSTSPTATSVALAASPAAGFTFFLDGGCTTAAASASVPSGATGTAFFFKGTAAGVVMVTASASGMAPATQDETLEPGAATHFTWSPIATPQPAGHPFTVTLTARDLLGNVATGFTGTAALALAPAMTPAPALSCSAGCAGTSTTAFSAGSWTGGVSVSEPASPSPTTPDRWLVATSGALAGVSNSFAVVVVPDRSPPLARIAASPAVTWIDQGVTFDATGSSDYQTPEADLEVAWDFGGSATGPPPAGPWTAWSKNKTATTTFGAAGTYSARVAVRDADGDVGYASVFVVVRASASDGLCLVDAASAASDGASGCAPGDYRGTDGKLSITEALALAGAGMVVGFTSPMTIGAGGALSVPANVMLVGYGVALDGRSLVAAGGAEVIGLEVLNAPTAISVPNGASVVFKDLYVHDGRGFLISGVGTLERVRMERCTGACVATNDATGTDTLTIRRSEFRGSSTGLAVDVALCRNNRLALMAQSNLFAGFQKAVRLGCAGYSTIVNNTFEANATGVEYAATSTSSHSLRNNVFANHSTAAVALGGASFLPGERDRHLLWLNASDGGLGADPNALAADPGYLHPSVGDYRPSLGSPAVDIAVDLGLQLIPAFPTTGLRYLGAAPDRGGLETW